MFGMSLPEIVVILVIAVLVLGPDKLPEALVKFAKFFKYFKAQVSSAKSNFEQEVRIAELKADAAKLKSSVTDISSNVRKKLTFEELDELKKSASDFSTELKSLKFLARILEFLARILEFLMKILEFLVRILKTKF